VSLSHGIYEHLENGDPALGLAKHIGRGDVAQLLNSSELSQRKAAA
jgi:hypothetical protein